MSRKSVTGFLSVLFCLLLVAAGVLAFGAHKTRSGQTPIEVMASPSTITSGSQTTITVTLSGVTYTNQDVTLSYSRTGPSARGQLSSKVNGLPGDMTVFAGSSGGQFNISPTGNPGDTLTVTASCNGGQASGVITFE